MNIKRVNICGYFDFHILNMFYIKKFPLSKTAIDIKIKHFAVFVSRQKMTEYKIIRLYAIKVIHNKQWEYRQGRETIF